MKKVIASAGIIALGAASATAQITAGGQKPWSISGSLRGFYDDNINTAPEGPAKVDSFGVEVIPSAGINFASGPNTFSAAYIYDNRYYFERRNTDQSHDLEMALNHNFSARYSVGLNESFIIAQEPEILSGNGAVTTPLRSNGNNLHNMVGINAQAQLTRLFGLVFTYNNNIWSWDENAANTTNPTYPTAGQPSRSATMDFVEHTFGLDSTWALSETLRGIFGYKYDTVLYTSPESVENDPGLGNNGWPYGGPFYIPSDSRNNYSHFVYVGVDKTFSQDLSGSARVGLQYVNYYQDVTQLFFGGPVVRSVHDSLSPYAVLSLNYAYGSGDMLTFGFNYSHNQTDQTANAFNPGAGVTVDQESAVLYLTVKQQLTPISPDLVLTGSAQYQNSTFNGGPVNGETDNFFLFGLDLAYQITPHFSAETGYNFDVLASDISGRGYDRNQFFLGLKAAY